MVATPLAYALYRVVYLLATTGFTQFDSAAVAGESPTGLVLALAALLALGGVLGVASRRGYRATVGTAIAGLAVLPWLFPLNPIDAMAGQLLFLFGGTAAVGGAESVARDSDPAMDWPLSHATKYGLVGGFVHLSLGVAAHAVTRGFDVWLSSPVSFLLWSVGAVGTVVTGALPVYVWRRYQVVTPSLTLLAWVLWGVVRFWRQMHRLPLSEFAAVRIAAIRPYPDYLLQWPALFLALVLVTVVEWYLRKRRRPEPGNWTPSGRG